MKTKGKWFPLKNKDMLNAKSKTALRKVIREHFGHCNLGKIRTYLKSVAKNEYGTTYARVKIGGGVELLYTENSNHFCKFGFVLNGIGMCNTLAMTYSDLTRAGKQRGCDSHYAL